MGVLASQPRGSTHVMGAESPGLSGSRVRLSELSFVAGLSCGWWDTCPRERRENAVGPGATHRGMAKKEAQLRDGQA